MMKTTRRAASALAMSAAAMLTIAGCTGEAKLQVEPDALGEQVATALAESVGADVPPNVDCGEDTIYPKNDLVVMCILSVEGDTDAYDVTVTFDSVEGTEYHFNSIVADQPRA